MKHFLSEEQETKQQPPGLELSVVFTTVPHTLLSLQAAAQLTQEFKTRIQLLVPHPAPFPASEITPCILADFTARYFLTLLPHRRDLQIKIVSYPAHTTDLWEVLPPRSLIVITGRQRHFWLSVEQRFARQLQQAGHEVIFLPAPE